MKTYTIPDFKKISEMINEQIDFWTWSVVIRKSKKQDWIPAEQQLAKKIGITKRDKVFVFAGFFGNWALALSKDCEVTYSDITPEIVKYARQNLDLENIVMADALHLPIHRDRPHWVFSFEPYPLASYFNMIALQTIAFARKGLKLVYIRSTDNLEKDLKKLAKQYGLKVDLRKIELKVKESRKQEPVFKEAKIITLRNKKQPDKLAKLDLETIRYLQNYTVIGENEVEKLSEQLTITPTEFKEVIERIFKAWKNKGDDIIRKIKIDI